MKQEAQQYIQIAKDGRSEDKPFQKDWDDVSEYANQ